jgi:hypothetical protein
MAREDRSPEFIGVLGFFIATCTLLVFLRVYCKLVIVKNFAADDYFSVLTLVRFTHVTAIIQPMLTMLDRLRFLSFVRSP